MSPEARALLEQQRRQLETLDARSCERLEQGLRARLARGELPLAGIDARAPAVPGASRLASLLTAAGSKPGLCVLALVGLGALGFARWPSLSLAPQRAGRAASTPLAANPQTLTRTPAAGEPGARRGESAPRRDPPGGHASSVASDAPRVLRTRSGQRARAMRLRSHQQRRPRFRSQRRPGPKHRHPRLRAASEPLPPTPLPSPTSRPSSRCCARPMRS